MTYRPMFAIKKKVTDEWPTINVEITSTELYLPVIDLPTDYKAEMVRSLNTELTKYITWEKLEKVTKDVTVDTSGNALLEDELFASSGAVLSYSNFKNVNRYYGYDLSRQKKLEFEPKKPQSIGFRGTFNKTCRVHFLAFKQVTLKVDMKNPFNTTLF